VTSAPHRPDITVGDVGDVGMLSPVSASAQVRALTGDTAVLTAVLAVESGWATVLEDAHLVPEGSATLVAAAAETCRYDTTDLAVRGQAGGNPVIPLVADLRTHVTALDTSDIGAAQAVHASLTSQDVLDTALMLMARTTIDSLMEHLRSTTTALAVLAEQHADTLCVGRSLTQHSLPYTFGLRAAQWFHGIAAAGRQLEDLELPVQFGGAAGTLAAGTHLTSGSSATPFDLSDALASHLGLMAAVAPWHTNRRVMTSLGGALAAVLDSFGKIAADVLFLNRPEVGELAEPRAAGRGASSAMPQKQNPVLSVLIRSAALQAPQLVAQLHLAAATSNDERPDGAWHAEWPALRQLLSLALGTSLHVRELTEGLQIFPDAMSRNLGLTGPLLLSEGISDAVAPLLADNNGRSGKQQLQDVVDEALRASPGEQGITYRELLRNTVPTHVLTDDQLEELLDPSGYLGQARQISQRILAGFPGFGPPDTGSGVALSHDSKGASHG
jgi:3-carboxy-cis,cis-muconate cycloisomerase